jgi:hypothetical protein
MTTLNGQNFAVDTSTGAMSKVPASLASRESFAAFISSWITTYGTGRHVTMDEICALPKALDLTISGTRKELGSRLIMHADALAGFRLRRVRRGTLRRKPRGAAGYFYVPPLWIVEPCGIVGEPGEQDHTGL